MSEWQTTPPPEDMEAQVLTYWLGTGRQIAYPARDVRLWMLQGEGPSHWMPLPDPPKPDPMTVPGVIHEMDTLERVAVRVMIYGNGGRMFPVWADSLDRARTDCIGWAPIAPNMPPHPEAER